MQDELKNIWGSASQPVEVKEINIDKIINRKSVNLIDKLKKTVKHEHTFNLILSPVMVGFLIWLQKYELAIGLTILLIPILIYYHFLLRKLKNHHIETNVYQYMIDSYKTLRAFVNHYYVAAIFIMIFSLYLGFELGSTIAHGPNPMDSNLSEIKMEGFITWIVGSILSVTLAYLFIYLLYGRKVKRLKRIIEEFESQS